MEINEAEPILRSPFLKPSNIFNIQCVYNIFKEHLIKTADI